MTGQFIPEDETADRVDLGSFPQGGVAVVFGAGGGIGGALVAAVQAAAKFKHVVSFSHSTSSAIDLLDVFLDKLADNIPMRALAND